MAFSIKKYINEKGEKMMNIWDSSTKSWVFDYLKPKYKIAETNLQISKKKIFDITDKKDSKSYLYDVVNKVVFELGIAGIKFKRAILNENDFGDSKFSIYRGVDNEMYVVFADGKYFKLPKNKHRLTWCGLTDKYLFIQYDTKQKQNNKLGSYYGHTIFYYKIFDKDSGKELFSDYNKYELMFNSSYKQIWSFSDEHNTYFIKDDSITKTFNGYVYDDDKLNSGKRHEFYILLTFQTAENRKNSIYKASHQLIVNKNGDVIREVDGLHIEEIASLAAGHVLDAWYTKHDENDNIVFITPISKKYGKNFQTDWFRYFGKNDYVKIENYKGESLLKFNDVKEARIFISKQGDMFFVCIRNGYIYIYDEDWNCLSDEWVIYSKYKTGPQYYDTEEYDCIDRAIKFNYETGRFMFMCAHAKINDGSCNTEVDWTYKSSNYDNKGNIIPNYVF